MKTSKQYKRGGCLWMASPLIALVVIFLAWAIISFAISQSIVHTAPAATTTINGITLSRASQAQTAARLINVALGFLGIIAVLFTPIGVLISLRYFGLARQAREAEQGKIFDPASGQGEASVIPPEAHRWSWAGLGAGWIWGLYHGVWISLLLFIPLVNFFIMFYLGFKGRELAWKKNKWTSAAAFDEYQKKWDMVGIVLFVFSILSIMTRVTLFSAMMHR